LIPAIISKNKLDCNTYLWTVCTFFSGGFCYTTGC